VAVRFVEERLTHLPRTTLSPRCGRAPSVPMGRGST
jgi:hypothetical protein